MKKFKLLTVVFVFLVAGLFGTTSGFAGDPANSCMDQIRQKLVENLKYPAFAHKEAIEGSVTIIFSIADEKINVKGIIATDRYLGTYVKEQVSGIRCTDFSMRNNQDFKIKIHFSLK